MQGTNNPDVGLLAAFDEKIVSVMPHLAGGEVVNPTPLVDITSALLDCSREEYGLDLSGKHLRVFGKSEAALPGGSIKSRPAVQIVREAIASGRLRKGMVVFEATSGNFGISLGMLGELGVRVVVLVSRRLQHGVLEALEGSNVKTVDLDVDVCPAPGTQMDPNTILAKAVATNMRERFAEIGLDTAIFDSARGRVEEQLARQDVISLAKLFAEVYGGFCPEQYDNEQNVRAHETITGPEIEAQLRGQGASIEESRVVCAFGTGGTSGGLSRYVMAKHGGAKVVHVVFPPEGRDVAGIRTKSKASGLRFYEPGLYAGEHEVDFEQAKKLLGFMARRGYDIGESSALALYAVVQMANFGIGGTYVAVLADGAKKYRSTVEEALSDQDEEGGLEVTLEAANAKPERFGEVVWTHMGYAPNEEGKKLIARMLGRPEGSIRVAAAADVVRLITARDLAPSLASIVDGEGEPGPTAAKGGGPRGKVLLVCMSGNTSLKAAQVLESKGIRSQSLVGGITKLAQSSQRPVPTLVKPA